MWWLYSQALHSLVFISSWFVSRRETQMCNICKYTVCHTFKVAKTCYEKLNLMPIDDNIYVKDFNLNLMKTGV